MLSFRPLSLILLVLTAFDANASAATDDARARAVLDRARVLSKTVRHWNDREQVLALQITDRSGGIRNRKLRMWTKRFDDDASKTILFFSEPPQARGVGFLQWVDARGPDSQWLYLPSTKRVRQISGSKRKESFVGTDFSYEDLGLMMDIVTWTSKDAISTFVREEKYGGVKCAVIKLAPTEVQDVSYSAIEVWVGKKDGLVHRYNFLDDRGRLRKTLVLSDFRAVDGIPSPHRLEMLNTRARSRTVASVVSMKLNANLSDEYFSKRRLEQGDL